MAENQNKAIHEGSYATQETHHIRSDFLEKAIASFEAAATRFAYDVIKNEDTRKRYMAHIKEVSDEVRKEVDSGRISVKEGALFCNQTRDQLFVEYRKYTTATGVAEAERLKLKAKGFDYYLDRYAMRDFGKPFSDLAEVERNKVYYEVIKSAGRPNAGVNARIMKMRAYSTVLILLTAMLAANEVYRAEDKIKELARQGSIIAGGMVGGGVAGFYVSFLCGPAEPICAIATVTLGSTLGGMIGGTLDELYQMELEIFTRWNAR
ncbi:hypothetical protein [Burkholderia sp. Ac-20353]|uniref:hypothetical protein n=1 Tax=Burkholderia sp. Ac-20353 TaxID=2703894 RepID=UPI001F11AF4A|nr:hypothetical protein [Burkholderia sp. Ac-20353]